jgi:VWFA-related protein
MKIQRPALLVISSLALLWLASVYFFSAPVPAQTRERTVHSGNTGPARGSPSPDRPPLALPGATTADIIKVDVDLVVVDALVMQPNTGRVVGDLKKDDFLLFEDGTRQTITHFSQDMLPLSVLLLIDRGGCLDPFGSQVRRAALDALSRLKSTDEVAVMTYHDTTKLIQGFTRDRALISDALNHVPPHDEEANHCLNKAFSAASDYMEKAANPTGRRVIIAITGVTRYFDCPDGPSAKAVTHAVLESGSVVCGLIPKTGDQRLENGILATATGVAGLFGAPSLSIEKLAEETGGEVLEDKPEKLDVTFNTLVSHLRTRYSLGFVSANKKRDGAVRKLKLDVAPAVQKSQGKLVVKARRSYVAPRS